MKFLVFIIPNSLQVMLGKICRPFHGECGYILTLLVLLVKHRILIIQIFVIPIFLFSLPLSLSLSTHTPICECKCVAFSSFLIYICIFFFFFFLFRLLDKSAHPLLITLLNLPSLFLSFCFFFFLTVLVMYSCLFRKENLTFRPCTFLLV